MPRSRELSVWASLRQLQLLVALVIALAATVCNALASGMADIAAPLRPSFEEELTMKPLANGQLQLLFKFKISSDDAHNPHHSLTPPSLLTPLLNNDVQRLHLSFVAGKWDFGKGMSEVPGEPGRSRSLAVWPLHPEVGGSGAEMRVWFADSNGTDVDARWKAVTNSMAGLFCSSLGQIDKSITTSPRVIYSGEAPSSDSTLLRAHLPSERLCTENLTPFLKLLPSKGLSGLSGLMKPYKLLAHRAHAMGVEVDFTSDGGVVIDLFWEALVDLADLNKGGRRDFSVASVFGQNLPRPFPLASKSVIRLLTNDGDAPEVVPEAEIVPLTRTGWTERTWELDQKLFHRGQGNIGVEWPQESSFVVPTSYPSPPVIFARSLTGHDQLEGGFHTIVRNNDDAPMRAIYHEDIPWWLLVWSSEIRLTVQGDRASSASEKAFDAFSTRYTPARARERPTTLDLLLDVPAHSTVHVRIPFTKQFIQYDEHPPDAHRGFDLSPGILYLLPDANESSAETGEQTYRQRLVTTKLLVDLATPDFSMPYNVIIMTSTLIALFFGSTVNLLVRRLSVVQVPLEEVSRSKKVS